MTKLRCCFCQQELHKDSDGCYTCYTDNCGCMKYGGNGASGSESLWLALIRTRKALDVAVDALKKCHETFTESEALIVANKHNRIANAALEQITALEQNNDIKGK